MKAGSELRAVAFDLDDTILRDDLTISDYTVYVLRRLHSDGYCIIAASGRARLSMKPYVDQIGCVNAYISCNGAEIWDGPSGSLIRQELLPITEYVLDIDYLAQNKDKILLAIGTYAKEHDTFLYQIAREMSKQINKPYVLVPGHHGSFMDDAANWANRLDELVRSFACKETSGAC